MSEAEDFATQSSDGVLLRIRVLARAREETVSLDSERKRVIVRVKAAAREGKANERVKQVLKKILGPCEIQAGLKTREKTVLVKNTRLSDVIGKLCG